MKLTGEPATVEPGLDAMEVDIAFWVAKYLNESREQLKATYSYNMTLNLDTFFDVLKYSPGTEEYAVLWAIEDIHCKLAPSYDFVVFDTPPTALSLRFLSLPTISGLWVSELTKLRERILDRRQSISRLNPESPVAESCVDKADDKVYGKLGSIQTRLAALEALFARQSFMCVIVNPDELSVFEALRIKSELARLKIPLSAVCVNKQGVSDAAWAQDHDLAELPQFVFDFSRNGVKTRDDLGAIGALPLARYFTTQGTQKR
jgi:arsenite-transporting ATPase